MFFSAMIQFVFFPLKVVVNTTFGIRFIEDTDKKSEFKRR